MTTVNENYPPRWAYDLPPSFITDPNPDTCNVLVTDNSTGRERPCRSKPRRVGDLGKTLCAWHLRCETELLGLRAEQARVEAAAAPVIEDLGELLNADVYLQDWPEWRVPDRVVLELTLDQARVLVASLLEAR